MLCQKDLTHPREQVFEENGRGNRKMAEIIKLRDKHINVTLVRLL
jgi:hypothetical protein